MNWLPAPDTPRLGWSSGYSRNKAAFRGWLELSQNVFDCSCGIKSFSQEQDSEQEKEDGDAVYHILEGIDHVNEVFIFLVVLREVCLNQFFSSTQSFMTTSTKQGHPSETKDGGNYRSGWDANHTTNAAIVPAHGLRDGEEDLILF